MWNNPRAKLAKLLLYYLEPSGDIFLQQLQKESKSSFYLLTIWQILHGYSYSLEHNNKDETFDF